MPDNHLEEFNKYTDELISILQTAKSVLKNEDLSSCFEFYKQGFHKLHVFQGPPEHYGITDYVHSLTLRNLENIFFPLNCTVSLNVSDDHLVRFYVNSHLFGEKFGEIEMPNSVFFFSLDRLVGSEFNGTSIEDLEHTLTILKKIESSLTQHGMVFQFSS